MKSRALLPALLALSALLLAFVPARRADAAPADKLIIVSPHWEGIRTEFTRGFKDWYRRERRRDVEIQWLDQGGSSDDLRFVHSEFTRKPAGIGIDLFFGGGIDPYLDLVKDNLLAPVKMPAYVLKKIPAELNGVPLYDAKYRWYGAAVSGFGILYNKKLVSAFHLPVVHTWKDLTSPKLSGWIGGGDPRHSGSVHVMYEIILQRYGWDQGWAILLQLAANTKTFQKSSSQIQKDLASGEVAYGLCIDTYAYTAIEDVGEDKLGFIFPAADTVVTPDPIAMLKGAPNPDVARDFIRYVLTPEAQRIWMYRKGAKGGPAEFSINKMSVVPSIYGGARGKSIIRVNPFKQRTGFRYDFEKGAVRWNVVNDLIGVFLIDNQSALIAAWKRVAAAGDKKAAGDFLKFPVTEKQAMQLAAADWNDPIKRNQQINAWLNVARKKYETH